MRCVWAERNRACARRLSKSEQDHRVALDVSVSPRDGEVALQTPQRPAPPCTTVIFGASGDLTHRKLIPALSDVFRAGMLNKHFAVLGFSRSGLSDDDFRRTAREGLEHYATGRDADGKWEEFSRHLHYMSGQFDDPSSYRLLCDRLERIDAGHGTQGNRVFYLATPPELFKTITRQLGDAGLNQHRDDSSFVRLV